MNKSEHIGQYVLTYDMKEEMIKELNKIKQHPHNSDSIINLSNIVIELISRLDS